MFSSYQNNSVKDATDEQLLFELIQRNKLHPAPVKKTFGTAHHEVVIEIGNDDVAWLQIDADSLKILKNKI